MKFVPIKKKERFKLFIVGIEPKAPGVHIFTQNYMPRLGLPLLLTGAKQLGHECVIFCEELKTSQVNWDDIARADIIMLSSLTTTAPRAYELVKKIRACNSTAPILGGGPHFTFEYREALDEGIDYVFRHWAHKSFFEWLAWYEGLDNFLEISSNDLDRLRDTKGLAFKIANNVHATARPDEVDPDTWPTVDFRVISGYEPTFITVITSEGCDHNCEFCSEWLMHGAHYRVRSPEKVIEDLNFYRKLYGNIPIFFGDDNMAADIKNSKREVVKAGPERLKELCKMIFKAGLKGMYSGQVCLDLANHPDVLEAMAEIGFYRVCIGYETVQPANQKATGNKLEFARMGEQTAMFHKYGIEIHAMWVLGFDADTLETVKETIRLCIKWHISTNQFLILTPVPGSPFRARLIREGRLISDTSWKDYDGHHVLFIPKGMKPWELQAAVMLEAMPKVYSYWQTALIFIANNWRIFTRWFSLRPSHPFTEFKGNLLTLILRLKGVKIVKCARKPAEDHMTWLRDKTS